MSKDKDFKKNLKVDTDKPNKKNIHLKARTHDKKYTGLKNVIQKLMANPNRAKAISAVILALAVTIGATACHGTTKYNTFDRNFSITSCLDNMDRDTTCLDEAIDSVMRRFPEIDLNTMENDFARYSELTSSRRLSTAERSELSELQTRIATSYPEFVENLCLNVIKAKVEDATGIERNRLFTNYYASNSDGSQIVSISEQPSPRSNDTIILYSTANNTLQSQETIDMIKATGNLQSCKRGNEYVVGNNYEQLVVITFETYNQLCNYANNVTILVVQTRSDFESGAPGRLVTDVEKENER